MSRPSKDIPTRGQTRKALKKCECPYCGPKGEVTGDAIEIREDTASQDQECLECGHSWTAFYDLCAIRWYSKDGDGDWVDTLYTRKREGR